MFSSLKYPEEVNFLSLEKMRTWDYPVFRAFQYDDVSDEQISAALKDIESIKLVDPLIDWEDDDYLSKNNIIEENLKHAYRVASIVLSIKDKGILSAIEIDTYSCNKCGFCIPNGHHRIRAFEFMGIDVVPFSLNGECDIIEDLCALCEDHPVVNSMS